MDQATPNLPSRDFEKTARFFSALGFKQNFRDKAWMILSRGHIMLEFFPHVDLNPATSWFGCCLRMDDLDGFYAICKGTGLVESTTGHPRLHPPKHEGELRIAALIDPDGTLIRLIQNQPLKE